MKGAEGEGGIDAEGTETAWEAQEEGEGATWRTGARVLMVSD